MNYNVYAACKYVTTNYFSFAIFVFFVVVVIGENQPGQSGQTEIHLQDASGYSEKVQYVLKTKLLLWPVWFISVPRGSNDTQRSSSLVTAWIHPAAVSCKYFNSYQMYWSYILMETYGQSICLSSYWLLMRCMELDILAGWSHYSRQLGSGSCHSKQKCAAFKRSSKPEWKLTLHLGCNRGNYLEQHTHTRSGQFLVICTFWLRTQCFYIHVVPLFD